MGINTAREVVLSALWHNDTSLGVHIAFEGGLENRVLEALGILQVEIDLAELASISSSGTDAGLRREGVKEEREAEKFSHVAMKEE